MLKKKSGATNGSENQLFLGVFFKGKKRVSLKEIQEKKNWVKKPMMIQIKSTGFN